ncbi:hypothetical protein OMP38_24095 [Cohnella ginsengisoli]|uniref:Uncharacterized protein n=1 Tax=Cohnella ginsengisoli TaxID=425004 RepID=A0A9X4KKG7_9BACL|nr:hypothetical protein [Cohnella ginsengisoli]MDG0793571.1 hypothetical protein [Cohnella ginsengisoli]
MDPWVTLVIAGAAIAGYGWLKPEPKEQAAAVVNEEAYDRLLEDLETENRELVDAVAAFKREQDDTVSRLGRRIRELERQMEEAAAYRKSETIGREPSVATKVRAASPALPVGADLQSATGGSLPEAGPPASGSTNAAERKAPAQSGLTHEADRPSPSSENGRNRLQLGGAADDGAPDIGNNGGTPERPAAIRERYAELLELYERGRSVEQVAKAMNMNKGEVQLILQLAKREVNRP